MLDLRLGNCLEILKHLPENSVDSIVTDPPYGLAFMGKKWDYDVPSVDIWRECLRVLKPGGHLLAFGGTRTYHRLVVAIEDAGFEIRDQIQWIYGQGFPKSHDISKAIDKTAGAEREVVSYVQGMTNLGTMHDDNWKAGSKNQLPVTTPATPEAQKWSGWGTALKPANEPICLARKPLSEKTVAANVLKHGTGGLNIDGTRIPLEDGENLSRPVLQTQSWKNTSKAGVGSVTDDWKKGRFPANVIFDEAAAEVLDGQSGYSTSKKAPRGKGMGFQGGEGEDLTGRGHDDSGGASRFFYVAKASKSDRGEGNTHPTVKPIKLMEYLIKLMEYLIKLVTPEGGKVLDPFMGSGTTGVAAENLGFSFIGIELLPEHFEICKKRLKYDEFDSFFE